MVMEVVSQYRKAIEGGKEDIKYLTTAAYRTPKEFAGF